MKLPYSIDRESDFLTKNVYAEGLSSVHTSLPIVYVFLVYLTKLLIATLI